MTTDLHIAVLGAGRIGPLHGAAIASVPFHAVADPFADAVEPMFDQ